MEPAVDAAIRVFWEHGYEGATLDDLTAAMGINRSSLYAAFGNKEGLFRAVVQRYAQTEMAYVGEALAKDTAHELARHYLFSNVRAITADGKPRGCLSIQGGLSGSLEDQRVVEFLRESRLEAERAIADRLSELQRAGSLPAEADPAELATFLSATTGGMAVAAASGQSRARLQAVAERALSAFPH